MHATIRRSIACSPARYAPPASLRACPNMRASSTRWRLATRRLHVRPCAIISIALSAACSKPPKWKRSSGHEPKSKQGAGVSLSRAEYPPRMQLPDYPFAPGGKPGGSDQSEMLAGVRQVGHGRVSATGTPTWVRTWLSSGTPAIMIVRYAATGTDGVIAAASSMIGTKSAALRLHAPTSSPSTPSMALIQPALCGFTEPPYRIRVSAAAAP